MRSKTGSSSPTQFLSQTDREIQNAEKERTELDSRIAGLKAARKAFADHILASAAEPRSSDGGTRVALLKEILTSAKKPLSVSDILTELEKHGHVTSRANLSSTLTYMQTKNLAGRVGRGLWGNVTQLESTKAA